MHLKDPASYYGVDKPSTQFTLNVCTRRAYPRAAGGEMIELGDDPVAR